MVPTFKKGQLSAGIKHGYRSGLEERNADQYIAYGVSARFEPMKIGYRIERNTSYTPDFIQDNAIIIETKGRFLPKDRAKHLLIKKQHPDLDIRFVFSNPKSRLNKKSQTTYGDWCEKHNFQYAKGLVPAEWMEEDISSASYEALSSLGYDFAGQ